MKWGAGVSVRHDGGRKRGREYNTGRRVIDDGYGPINDRAGHTVYWVVERGGGGVWSEGVVGVRGGNSPPRKTDNVQHGVPHQSTLGEGVKWRG